MRTIIRLLLIIILLAPLSEMDALRHHHIIDEILRYSEYRRDPSLYPTPELIGIWAYDGEVTNSTKLSYKQNNLVFVCGTREKLPMDTVNYEFKLRGDNYHIRWDKAYKGGWYLYTDLPPGDYEFTATCRYVKGKLRSSEIYYEFTIEAPWWSSWWAWIIFIIAGAGLLAGLWYLIASRIRKHNRLVVEKENYRFRTEFIIQVGKEFEAPVANINKIAGKIKGSKGYITRPEAQHLCNSSKMLMQMMEQLPELREAGKVLSCKDKNEEIEISDTSINKDFMVVVIERDFKFADVIKQALLKIVSVKTVPFVELFFIVADKRKPDLVIIDIDDQKDAYKYLCLIRMNPSYKSIPVILISNFADSQSLIKAIRSDADYCIAKPLNMEVLTAFVAKMIKNDGNLPPVYKVLPQELKKVKKQNKRKKPEKQKKNAEILLLPYFENSSDRLLLERIDTIIQSSISVHDFDVNSIAEVLGISRDRLYNKIKSMCGMTPLGYLRELRLNKAASLLRNTNMSITEISRMVGMPDTYNFNVRFKKRYEVIPSKYRKNDS